MGSIFSALAGSDDYATVCNRYDRLTGANQITVEEMRSEVQRSYFLIDTRTKKERDVSTIRESAFIEKSIVGFAADAQQIESVANSIPSGAVIVCFCTAGLRSGHAARALKNSGKEKYSACTAA